MARGYRKNSGGGSKGGLREASGSREGSQKLSDTMDTLRNPRKRVHHTEDPALLGRVSHPSWNAGDPVRGQNGEIIMPDQSGVYDAGNDVELAANLLSRGCRVQLEQPEYASAVIEELKGRIDRMEEDAFQNWCKEKNLPYPAPGDDSRKELKKQWEDDPDAWSGAPQINLCDIYVPRSNLFCIDNKGRPRIEMPQLKAVPLKDTFADSLPKDKGEADLTEYFLDELREEGYRVGERETVPASHLRATQSELNGKKVGGMLSSLVSDKIVDEETGKTLHEIFDDDDGIVVSRDGYILDGHHRWAALVGLDARDGNLGDVTVPIRRVDIGIVELLEKSNDFCEKVGLPRADASHSNSANAE